MTRSNGPRRGVSCALRVKFLMMLALLAAALLIAGCKKNAGDTVFTGNENTSNTNQSNTTVKDSAEVTRDKADRQGQATQPDKGNFSVQYSTVRNPKYVQINENFRQRKLLESIANDLNASIAIPENVMITFKECGQPNAFWDPKTRSINMCYELMEQMTEDFRSVAKNDEDLGQKVNGALTFAFIHELGHCLIDVLHLPATGREEDAVDQLSTFVLLALEGDEGEQMAISGALSWAIQYDKLAKSGKTAGELNMLWADEHSMDAQRFYNVFCWVFGHNPEKWKNMVPDPLPEQRAVRCPMEYSKLATAWLTLLKPYLKDGGAKAAAHTGPMMGGTQTPSPAGDEHSGH
ncbi:MAG: hypothetical protein QOH63_3371 [Acidobacteriota bacterium]|nr:hypothetical protein [Acidobacteriota bacterium]